ncbi:MAG: transcriptional regulator [Pirellulaceae bacterium]|nr:transcriptional regulator [Pirellulaceae bacterium]
MSTTQQNVNDSATDNSADLTQLIGLVAELPPQFRDRIQSVLGRVVESTQRRRRILTLVQEALGQLRLDMKYLVFDLEATRRERDEFKSRSEGSEE